MSALRAGGGEQWFKGNTHIHSTVSDGGKTFRQLEAMYARKGFHFLCRTDHWVASDVQADKPRAAKLLWLDGIELDGVDDRGSRYHVVALGKFAGIAREMGFTAALGAVRKQGGMLILAHPFWMGLSPEEVCRWNFDAVEIYNHVCQWLNGKGDNLPHWHHALAMQPKVLGIAADDTHSSPDHPGWNGGWIHVLAPACTPEAIMKAIRGGRYYSSCGPQFESIEVQGDRVAVQTSPVRFIRLVGASWNGQRAGAARDVTLTEAAFTVPKDWAYAYLEIEDARGRRAWSNPLEFSFREI